jgi:hypothetical protein
MQPDRKVEVPEEAFISRVFHHVEL